MPRRKKHRRCGLLITEKIYKPLSIPLADLEKVVIYRDELEALSLCGIKEFTQEEAGAQMCISRGTVQRLTKSGMKKILTAITENKAIVIEDYNTKKEE